MPKSRLFVVLRLIRKRDWLETVHRLGRTAARWRLIGTPDRPHRERRSAQTAMSFGLNGKREMEVLRVKEDKIEGNSLYRREIIEFLIKAKNQPIFTARHPLDGKYRILAR